MGAWLAGGNGDAGKACGWVVVKVSGEMCPSIEVHDDGAGTLACLWAPVESGEESFEVATLGAKWVWDFSPEVA